MLLIKMEIPEKMALDILTAIETPEGLILFLDKLSEKNYEMTPEEVYQAAGETISGLQTA